MKKKFIITESKLERFVKNFINENLETPTEKDSLTEMLEEKYQEIIGELKLAIDENNIQKIGEIYDTKIFDLNKNLHKVKDIDIVDKFAELEDGLIDYIEIQKEYSTIKEELDRSLENLKSLF